MEWNGMEWNGMEWNLENSPAISEQEFFVFCGMSEANEAKYKKQKK